MPDASTIFLIESSRSRSPWQWPRAMPGGSVGAGLFLRFIRQVAMVRNAHAHVFTPTRSSGCQGFAPSKGKQCRSLRSHGSMYCGRHSNQASCCRAITREGYRCSNAIHVDGRGYFCQGHCQWATPGEVVCRGWKVNTNEKCYRRVLHAYYGYCMHQHDPRVLYVNPQVLRRGNLRLIDQHGQDRYHPGRSLADGLHNHIDHIAEIQIPVFSLSFVTFGEGAQIREDIASVFNMPFNLCRTLATTNVSKGDAVTRTLDDMFVHSMRFYGQADLRALVDIRYASFNVPIVPTLTDRLREVQLGRDVTRLISQEMERSFSQVVAYFSDQGETPIYDHFAFVTLQTAQAMGLRVRSHQ